MKFHLNSEVPYLRIVMGSVTFSYNHTRLVVWDNDRIVVIFHCPYK